MLKRGGIRKRKGGVEGGRTKEGEEREEKRGGRKKGGGRKLRIKNFTAKDCFGMYDVLYVGGHTLIKMT